MEPETAYHMVWAISSSRSGQTMWQNSSYETLPEWSWSKVRKSWRTWLGLGLGLRLGLARRVIGAARAGAPWTVVAAHLGRLAPA